MDETFVFPVSYGQQRLWFIHYLEPDSAAYNIFKTQTFTGPLDLRALERSLNEISRRHEILRTSFAEVEGQPVQVIAPFSPRPLPVNDLSAHPAELREAELQRLIELEAGHAFNLATGPPWQARLITLTESEHVLLLTLHHIISDGWSMRVLADELSLLYEAYRTGAASPLDELPVQYADYAVWQRKWLVGETLEKQLAYWRKQLTGAPEVLELPTDRSRPNILSSRGANQWLRVSRPLTERLKELSRQEGVTLFMTLLAAFKTLLHRYTGQPDIVVGSPIANRPRQELEQLIGFFTNTLVLRTDLSGDPGFRELLGRVKEVCLGAYTHQDLPFEKLVEELQPERSLSRTPLFQVMLQLLTDAEPVVGSGDSPAENDAAAESAFIEEEDEMEVEQGVAISDLGIDFMEVPAGLIARVEYSTDLFDDATIRRLITHLQTLLSSVAANPGQRLSALPMISAAERQQLLYEWNSTERNYTDSTLHQLFERQVALTPEAVAVNSERERVTYAELNSRANRLARYLTGLGVGPEVRVCLRLERSVEALVGMLGVLKAGGAYFALDPEDPPQRLLQLWQDTATTLLLTQRRFAHTLPKEIDEAAIICLDEDWAKIARESAENPACAVTPENLALVIYTSGSTGQPKGVMLTQRGLCNRLLWGQETYGLSAADKVLQFFSYSFDFSTWEIFTALLSGAQLVLARPGGQKDAAYLAQLIAEQKVTVAGFVPSMLEVLLEEPTIRHCQSLRKVYCGGEALSVELQERFFARLAAELQNTYGPTEASIDVSFWQCRRGADDRSVPLGFPVANTQFYVLDDYLQPVPIGVPGELYLGGANLARGYLGHPALTSERFLPDPFGNSPGARLYRTGDAVRYRSDGAIEFLGRRDEQIKLRGFRVEPGEIEAVLGQHPAVREAVVLPRDDDKGGKRLVAYLVARPSEAASEEGLHKALAQFLKERLPEYFVPAAFVLLEAMPLTPHGKIDRRALPAPGKAVASDDYVAPQTQTERTIASIWQEVFGVEAVSIYDNFFDLGGHSLLLIRVHSKLREALPGEIPMLDLFRYPTISTLAKALDEKSSAAAPVARRPDERAEKQRAAAQRQKQLGQRRTNS